MRPFIFEPQKSRVVFGQGALETLPAEAERLGVKRLLLISTPEQQDQAKQAAQPVKDLVQSVFSGAVMHTPVDVTERVLEKVSSDDIDGFLSIGGGSTIGLGKALARRTKMPHIAVPTSYAGSEMTPILGETKDGKKLTNRENSILPQTVVYDVNLTLTLPWSMTVTSAMNAIAHAVEALYAKDRNPVVERLAEDGIAAFGRALRRLKDAPDDVEARSDALFGAWACGTCLGQVSMALHHKLCHVLGGSFDLPHAATHTIILPHASAFNGTSGKLDAVSRALGGSLPGQALFDLATELGAPTALAEIGFTEGDIDRAVGIAMENPYWNPRPFVQNDIESILSDAVRGARPEG